MGKQEAALKKLEQKHGAGYGKPVPGSKSEARAKRYNESCMREILQLCGLISEKGKRLKKHMKIGNNTRTGWDISSATSINFFLSSLSPTSLSHYTHAKLLQNKLLQHHQCMCSKQTNATHKQTTQKKLKLK